MCGIAGFNWQDDDLVRRMTEGLSHRGPDFRGCYSTEQFSFGHARLSILDLSAAGHQPMLYSRSRGVSSLEFRTQYMSSADAAVTFNGEIYNFQEIKKELETLGYFFYTHSDTEILLASYLEWGEECVRKFNGMWAFCLFDKKKDRLFLSRDRMGQKPLYYHCQDGRFVFGSELKTLFTAGVEKNIDPMALNHYFLFKFTPPEKTVFVNIHKLSPGHNLVFDLQSKRILSRYKYWSLSLESKIDDVGQATEGLASILEKAVSRRLVADVPVGAFLSGGLDSSIVVGLMAKHTDRIKTFSVGFDRADYNESAWALKVSKHFGTHHYEIVFTADDVRKLIKELAYFYDDPFADISMIPTYLVSKVAKEHVSVALSGMGADELFGGYQRYRDFHRILALRNLPSVVKKVVLKLLMWRNADYSAKLNLLLQEKDNCFLYSKLFSHMFRNPGDATLESLEPLDYKSFFEGSSSLAGMLMFDQNIYLPENGLLKEDRASMAFGLESRAPFMDWQVVQFANNLADHLKVSQRESKYILKKTFEGLLPREIVYRKKQGFGVPISLYFRGELKDFARDLLFDVPDHGFYDVSSVKSAWDEHLSCRRDYSPFLWSVMMFNLWYHEWCS